MFDSEHSVCKGYSDYPVEPYLVCSTWMADPEKPIEKDEYENS
jgi:hypothetical protein